MAELSSGTFYWRELRNGSNLQPSICRGRATRLSFSGWFCHWTCCGLCPMPHPYHSFAFAMVYSYATSGILFLPLIRGEININFLKYKAQTLYQLLTHIANLPFWSNLLSLSTDASVILNTGFVTVVVGLTPVHITFKRL